MILPIVDVLRHLSWTPNWWEVIIILAEGLALLTIPSVLLQRRGRPQAALSWVMVLFLLPYLGLFLWWVMGRKHLDRRRRKKRSTSARLAARLSDRHEALPTASEADLPQSVIDRLPSDEVEWVYPSTHGNRIELLSDASQMYPAMEQMIEAAQDHVHLLFYIWQADQTGARFRDLLVEKARQGVEVRVLLDAIGSSAARGRFMKPLRDAGADVLAFLPPVFFRRKLELNFRNHRKLALADAHAAIVGGINIGDEYLDQWRDSAIRLEGPVVDQLQEVFADDWYFTSGEDFSRSKHFGGWRGLAEEGSEPSSICTIIASGPHTELNFTHEALFSAICQAGQRIYLATPYFIPDQVVEAALRTAVFRGVDVRVLVPQRGDSRLVDLAMRSFFPRLLRVGVKIYEYTSGFMHAKHVIFDDELVMVGSANADTRSFRLNFELSCLVRDPALNTKLAGCFEQDLAKSRQLTLAEAEQTAYFRRLAESVAHLLSPLL